MLLTRMILNQTGSCQWPFPNHFNVNPMVTLISVMIDFVYAWETNGGKKREKYLLIKYPGQNTDEAKIHSAAQLGWVTYFAIGHMHRFFLFLFFSSSSSSFFVFFFFSFFFFFSSLSFSSLFFFYVFSLFFPFFFFSLSSPSGREAPKSARPLG